MHTTFSDGKDSTREMIRAAKAAGMERIAITDHFDPNDYRPHIARLDEASLLGHFAQIRRCAAESGIEALCGIETTPLPDGRLELSPRVREQCDVIITSCHYLSFPGEVRTGEFMNDAYWEAFRQYMLCIAAGPGDILGHCEEYLPIERMLKGLKTTFEQRRAICRSIAERYLDAAYVRRLTQALLESGKACELHANTRSPPLFTGQRCA